MSSKTFFGCSQCEYVLGKDEEFCPFHPNDEIIGPIREWNPQTMGRKGGLAKSPAKTKAAITNGKLGGRPKTGNWFEKLTLEQINHVRFESGKLTKTAFKQAMRYSECRSCKEIADKLGIEPE